LTFTIELKGQKTVAEAPKFQPFQACWATGATAMAP
jgi:hypothetical protein